MGFDKSIEDPWEREESEEEILEKERIEQEKLEQERLEQERLEQERLEKERLEMERLEMERLERERLQKERFEQLKMDSKLYPNNSLFMIPSWSDLLGYPALGTYVNHPVSKIETDGVIFFSGYDYSIETNKGTLHYLFGIGYYFLKFELESGKYVTDKRILTGLVLPDFAYDLMATSANITLEEDPDVIIAEKVIKVPVDLSNKSEDHLTFIKGALMRNVFIPHKDIFLEMMEQIRKEDSYPISIEGHKIISAHWDYYNQILVSDKMRTSGDSAYLNPTAGLYGIKFTADALLDATISNMNLSIIEDNIKTLKRIYSNLEFDPMYLFSIIEQAGLNLRSNMPPISSKRDSGTSKASVFASAEDRLYAFISWPIQFQRKAKQESKVLPKLVESPSNWEQIDAKAPDISKIRTEIREMEQEAFELETLKSETVELKPLPPPPNPDINQILLYLKKVIAENYDMPSIGQAFEVARESARQMGVSSTTLHQAKIWEMSKYTNIYIKKEPGFGLSEKEKGDLSRKIDEWIFEIAERERLEKERIEKARLEKERLERLERERKERERQEMQRKEMERLEQMRVEKERLAQEHLKRERLEKIEREKEEALRLETERLKKEQAELEAIEREKQELKRLKLERKQKEKEAKQEAKKQKKLEKQKKKLEKKKLKEQEKLKNLD
ncbi:MAG: hypothetical protein ACFFBY_09405 [Promethearchaeota archaeon]